MNRFNAAYRGLLVAAAVLTGATTTSSAAGVVVRGAGATFPSPVYARWAEDYQRETGVEIRYSPVGSGAGIEQLEQRLVDFGGSDVPLTPAERQRAGVFEFPAVIGGVVPVVNIRGIASAALKLTGQVLGDIYLGKVRKWNDPAIAALNPDLDLPASNITVVHRADASGTTYLWANFLALSNPDWKSAVGDAEVLKWPVGEAGDGNDGVASTVQRTRMSIGYVEYAYAMQRGLGVVSLRNHDGQFVAPGAAAFEAAVQAARWQSAGDLEQSLIDQAGAASWPITGASFIVMPVRRDPSGRADETLKFFGWALRSGRQTSAQLGYVPLPASAVELVGRLWEDEQSRAGGAGTAQPAR